MRVMYSGSFDPITYGHLDLIKRCSEKFDEVIVTVFDNNSKDHLFCAYERKKLVEEAVESVIKNKNVKVDLTSGMLVEYARKNCINLVIRGLRAVSDYEYELKIASINKHLYPELETIFMVASAEYSFISSSIVKEVAKLGGDISKLVPLNVLQEINKKFGRN